MKIFISWSGETSKHIAEMLRKWIPAVIQAAKPYYTPDDIIKGSRWATDISKELDESKIGIICLTSENLASPWILFEAGAISKNIDKSKVCPILFGIDPSDIKGPLVQFQAAKFDKEEIKRVVKMINSELGDKMLALDTLDQVFEMWWPRLEGEINKELNASKKILAQSTRTDRDILEEILSISRQSFIARDHTRQIQINSNVLADLVEGIENLLRLAERYPENKQILNTLKILINPVDYIIDGHSANPDLRERLSTLFEQFNFLLHASKNIVKATTIAG